MGHYIVLASLRQENRGGMMSIVTLKRIRYFFTLIMVSTAILLLVNPNTACLGLMSLSLSLAVLFQALELSRPDAKAGKHRGANIGLMLVASILNMAAAIYAFSTLL